MNVEDYVTELETQLLSAARLRRRRTLASPLPHLSRMSALIPAATVAGAISIAVVALVLVGTQGHERAASTEPAASHGLAAVPAAARPLVREFAVLRRPETAAEHHFAARFPPHYRGMPFRTISGLTRLLTRLPGGGQLYLQIVERERWVGLGLAQAGAVAVLEVVGHDSVSGIAAVTASGRTLPGLVPFRWGNEELQLVTDAMKRIVWHFADGRTVVPRIADNLAIASLPRGELGAPTVQVEHLAQRVRVLPSDPAVRSHLPAFPVRLATVRLHASSPAGPHGTATIRKSATTKTPREHSIRITARDLPANTHRTAYAIWLCPRTSATGRRLLGYLQRPVTSNGRVDADGLLPSNVSGERRVVIALQTTSTPTRPGRIVLAGLAPAGAL